jgi:hypothetical protein
MDAPARDHGGGDAVEPHGIHCLGGRIQQGGESFGAATLDRFCAHLLTGGCGINIE